MTAQVITASDAQAKTVANVACIINIASLWWSCTRSFRARGCKGLTSGIHGEICETLAYWDCVRLESSQQIDKKEKRETYNKGTVSITASTSLDSGSFLGTPRRAENLENW